MIFDGSSRLGEVFAIVLRHIETQWYIQQRLLKLETLAKSLKSQELAQRLIQRLAFNTQFVLLQLGEVGNVESNFQQFCRYGAIR